MRGSARATPTAAAALPFIGVVGGSASLFRRTFGGSAFTAESLHVFLVLSKSSFGFFDEVVQLGLHSRNGIGNLACGRIDVALEGDKIQKII